MGEPVQIDQMKLFCDIAEALAKQHRKLPADSRSNAVIKAADIITECYAMSNEEFVNKYGAAGERLR